MASFLYNISMLLYLPIVIYGPALAFAQGKTAKYYIPYKEMLFFSDSYKSAYDQSDNLLDLHLLHYDRWTEDCSVDGYFTIRRDAGCYRRCRMFGSIDCRGIGNGF